MASYTQPPYTNAPPMQSAPKPSRQYSYPVDPQMRPYGPAQQSSQASRPLPQQQYSMPVIAPAQYQQTPYATPQYLPPVPPQQTLQQAYPVAPIGNQYAYAEPYSGELVRPPYDARNSSHRSHRSSHSHSSTHDDGERRKHKKHHTESRPTIGDSVVWVVDSIKSVFSGSR